MKSICQVYIVGSICWLSVISAWAQRSELWREKHGTWSLNTGLGITHYAGDINESFNLSRLRLGAALNVAVAYRFTPQLSARTEIQLYYIHGTQQNTHLAYNNLSFRSLNPDLWAGIQWDFWKDEDKNHVIIPYALAGVGLTYLSPKATYKGRSYSLAPLHTEGVAYNRLPLILRYGLGVPVMATTRFKFNLEATYTHVRSDYVDDISTVYPSSQGRDPLTVALTDRRPELGQTPNIPGEQRGNKSRRDGYFILSGRLVFTLSTAAQRNYRTMFGG